jgi:hypothetical protein
MSWPPVRLTTAAFADTTGKIGLLRLVQGSRKAGVERVDKLETPEWEIYRCTASVYVYWLQQDAPCKNCPIGVEE